MLKTCIIGLGKMGISHMSMVNAHPDVDLVAVCDSANYMLDILGKNTGKRIYSDHRKMFADEKLDAVFIATPSRFHAAMVRDALDAGLHIFCEKPFVLDPAEGLELAGLAESKKRVNQIGYHYRFVASFREAKRVVESGILGKVHHIRSEAYGPVVLRSKGSSWRTNKSQGGGCLYDYACHVIDLMNYLVGKPTAITGAVLNSIFSQDVEDEVYATFRYPNGASGILNANWSDESHRKMSSKITLWGSNGKITVDRQEIQVYLRDEAGSLAPYKAGWTTRYTTELTDPQWFYLRGEEYSAQIDHFVQNCLSGSLDGENSFRSACVTDALAAEILRASQAPGLKFEEPAAASLPPLTKRRFAFFGRN